MDFFRSHSPAAQPPLVMMMRPIRIWLGRGSVQKIFFLLFLGAVVGSFRIVAFHLDALFRRQLWKMPDKQHTFPTVVFRPKSCESRHAREAHAVFYDPKKLAVGKFLRLIHSQVGRLGILAPADERVAAAIIPVACRAMIRKMQPRVAKIFRCTGDRIFRLARVCGNGEMPRIARHHRFKMRRRGAGAQPVMQNPRNDGRSESRNRYNTYQNNRSTLHSAEMATAFR